MCGFADLDEQGKQAVAERVCNPENHATWLADVHGNVLIESVASMNGKRRLPHRYPQKPWWEVGPLCCLSLKRPEYCKPFISSRRGRSRSLHCAPFATHAMRLRSFGRGISGSGTVSIHGNWESPQFVSPGQSCHHSGTCLEKLRMRRHLSFARALTAGLTRPSTYPAKAHCGRPDRRWQYLGQRSLAQPRLVPT